MFASVVVGVFLVTGILFVIFDCYLVERTEKIMDVALKQNAIVSSLFPENVQAKMMAEADQNEHLGNLGKAGIKRFLRGDNEDGETNQETIVSSKPIAGKKCCNAASTPNSMRSFTHLCSIRTLFLSNKIFSRERP